MIQPEIIDLDLFPGKILKIFCHKKYNLLDIDLLFGVIYWNKFGITGKQVLKESQLQNNVYKNKWDNNSITFFLVINSVFSESSRLSLLFNWKFSNGAKIRQLKYIKIVYTCEQIITHIWINWYLLQRIIKSNKNVWY